MPHHPRAFFAPYFVFSGLSGAAGVDRADGVGGTCTQAGTAWGAVLASAGAKLGFTDAAKRLFTANGAEVPQQIPVWCPRCLGELM